jgi:hypothetical protein
MHVWVGCNKWIFKNLEKILRPGPNTTLDLTNVPLIFLVLLYSGLLSTRIDTLVVSCLVSLSSSSYRANINQFTIFSHTRPNTVTLSVRSYVLFWLSRLLSSSDLICRSRTIPQWSSSFLLPPFLLFPSVFFPRVFFCFTMRVRRLVRDPLGTPTDEPTDRSKGVTQRTTDEQMTQYASGGHIAWICPNPVDKTHPEDKFHRVSEFLTREGRERSSGFRVKKDRSLRHWICTAVIRS